MVVMPIDDMGEHDMLSTECACMPAVEIVNDRLLITHNAFDFRDVAEWMNDRD